MKKLVLILLSIALFSCSKKEDKPVDYAVFSGKIENLDGGKLSLKNSDKIIKEINVQEDGTFTDTLQNIQAGYHSFKYANESSQLYLKPGYNLNMVLDSKQFDESIKYTGIGESENNYLVQKFLNEESLGKLGAYQYLGTLNEKEYVHKMDSIKQTQTDFLVQQKELDPEFKVYEEASITYKRALMLIQYALYKRYITKDQTFNVSKDYPDSNSGLNLEDESLMIVSNYSRYLSEYYSQKAGDVAKKEDIDHDLAYLITVSDEVKSPLIKEHLIYGSAKYGISYTKELQKYYDLFMANSSDEAHKKEISEKYNKLTKLSKGAPSPQFSNYENYKGGSTSMNDLKGKYVYIDVWATWCGPCKAEIPSLKEVEKKYHTKNIAFISMSIDKKKDYEKWRKMVDEKELSGIQLFAPNDWKSDFVTDYGIQGIPRFILIDPEGNIVDSNAPRPSSPKLIELFNDLKI